jgi:pimeloyl-ACP methyl ester carboxylesterase
MLGRLIFGIGIGMLSWITSQASLEAKERPVIIIPGIMGSKLCDGIRSDGSKNVVWGDRASYTQARINLLRLPPDPATRDRSIESCGIIDSVNLIPLLWESNVYSGLIKKLIEIGYKDSEILQFHYDWRLSNFENAELLKAFIKSNVVSGKVDIVAHSMGGLIARIYIQNLQGSSRVNNLLFFGTPHLGSAKIFQRLRDGFDNWPSALSGGLAEIQKTILSFPSTFQLLPTYSECCGFSASSDPVTASYVNILDPAVWKRFSWLPDDYKTGPRKDSLARQLKEAADLGVLMRQSIFENPNSFGKVHFVANGFVDTWSRVFFDPATGKIIGNTKSPGDGTVLLFSATNSDPGRVQISLKEHELVFGGREPELILTAVLSGQAWHAGNAGFTQILSDAQGRRYRVEAASLDITPRVAVPGSEITVHWTIRGEDAVQNAVLSNVRLEVFDGIKKIGAISNIDVARDVGSRAFEGKFVAPHELGSYRVELAIGGLETLDTIFAVVQP